VEDEGVNGRIILKWMFMKWDVDMDWMGLAQYRDRWLKVVNAVMSVRVPLRVWKFLTVKGTVSFSGRTSLRPVN
jgi:hypothetical protein